LGSWKIKFNFGITFLTFKINTMKEKQEALQLIKVVIDESIKAGLFKQIEVAVQVSNAFNLIATELQKDNDAQ